METYDKIFEKYRYNLNMKFRSRDWFKRQVTLLGAEKVSANMILTDSASHNRSGIIPGHMYLYKYDPKHKATLPYYDIFPLVFPFRSTKDGFIGLNMHYLPYKMRALLLDRLQQFRNNNKMDGNTKLKFSWGLLESVSKFDLAKPCVKQYLTSHVRSQFIKINSTDWATAMLLPVQYFVGTTADAVWHDSMRKIK